MHTTVSVRMFPGTKNRNDGTCGCSPLPKTGIGSVWGPSNTSPKIPQNVKKCLPKGVNGTFEGIFRLSGVFSGLFADPPPKKDPF